MKEDSGVCVSKDEVVVKVCVCVVCVCVCE